MTPTQQALALDALRTAVLQNDCDMLMTGEELRKCRAAIASLEAAPAAPEFADKTITAREVARQVFALCEWFEDLQDGVQDSQEEARFKSGQRFSAKRIRNGIGTWLTDEENARKQLAGAAPAAPLTDTYVQPVPDQCDRITWRGNYYHLPIDQHRAPIAYPIAENMPGAAPAAVAEPAEPLRKEHFDLAAFSAAISRSAEWQGLTMKEVASKTGVNETTLSRMRNEGRRPDAASIAALSSWAGINPANYDSRPRKGGLIATPPPTEPGEIVVTKNEAGQIVAVTRQDEEGRVLSVVAESTPPTEPSAEVVLPEPDLGMPWRVNAASDGSAHSAGYTADQMRAYGDARAAAAILADRAARVPLTDEQIDGLNGLDTASRVRFYEHDFYVLSNFSAFRLRWRDIDFDTSEHAYHCEKFFDTVVGIAHEIQGAESAHEAFKIAERNKHLRRHDWDDVKVSIMLGILRAKAAQHEYVRRKLLATGDRELVEDSWRDDYWGWGQNRDGKNMLGKLWMQVRAELRGITPTAPTQTGAPKAGAE